MPSVRVAGRRAWRWEANNLWSGSNLAFARGKIWKSLPKPTSCGSCGRQRPLTGNKQPQKSALRVKTDVEFGSSHSFSSSYPGDSRRKLIGQKSALRVKTDVEFGSSRSFSSSYPGDS